MQGNQEFVKLLLTNKLSRRIQHQEVDEKDRKSRDKNE
jgi:hypothetical protein